MRKRSSLPVSPSRWQHRSVVSSRQGMVATASHLASLTGVEVLKSGGNAMDAAIAVAGVLNVTMPMMCGLLGDVFLIHASAEGKVEALNGSGICAYGASRDYYLERGHSIMPLEGVHSFAVPGAVDAYYTALQRWGTRSLAELWQPALHYAEHGFVMPGIAAKWFADAASTLAKYPTSARVFLPKGRPPREGELFVQRDMARSIRALLAGGRDELYRGELGRQVTDFIAAKGGLLGLEEFASQESEVYEPLSVDYRGHTIYQTKPPSQGMIVLEEMNIIEGYDLAAMGFQSVDEIHLMVEAKKLAFGDRNRYAREPRAGDMPLRGMLAKQYAAGLRERIDRQRAAGQQGFGDPWEHDGDTTYFAVVDGDGNCVSFIQSISAVFGSQVVAGETGLLLNNRAGRGFSLEEGHPNVIEPGKKTMHTLNAWLVANKGVPWLVGGTPGGDQQPQWNMQVLSAIIDHGLNVQQAAEMPRWQSFPGTDPADLGGELQLMMETRFPRETREQLAARGHKVVEMGPWGAFSGVQLIEIDPETGIRHGGSDPRVDGMALGC